MKNMRKAAVALLAAICMMASVCTLGVFAEGTNQVTAETSESIQQGSGGYCYVYLDDLTEIATLTVSVYYDTEKVTVTDSYNQVACTLYDSSNKNGCLQYSYIFDGEGNNEKTNLFYFYYQISGDAPVGRSYFDIVVSDAYTAELDTVDISGSRCNFSITEASILKECCVYGTDSISTSVKEEFEIAYYLYEDAIASGSFSIQYDSELFEVVEITKGGLFDNKVVDTNTNLNGSVVVSFVGTAYNYQYDLVMVKFRTLKNMTESSEIKFIATEFYDLDLNGYVCNGYTTAVNVELDESYTEDAPSMSVGPSYNAETGKVTATIKLEKDSMLGAGDFFLKFDTRYLTYISAEKGFSPTFFNINDKDVAEGILKFSIISLSDITDEQIVLTVVFDAKHYCQEKTADFEISGSGLTDSLVNTIQLNFVDASILIPLKHTAASAVEENRVEPTCTGTGSYDSVVYCSVCNAELSREEQTIDALGHTPNAPVVENRVEPTCTEQGSFDSVVYCSVCNAELTREEKTIAALGHAYSPDWTVDLVPTCTESGSKSHHCDRCGYKTEITEIPANGHSFGKWYEVIAPTCAETGLDEQKCAVCGHAETRATEALGHTPNAPVVENRIEPTCTEQGSYDSVAYCYVCSAELFREKRTIDALGHKPGEPVAENSIAPTCTEQGSYDSVIYCSVCKTELIREGKVIDALGHEYNSVVTAPTCTEKGYTVHTCSRCNDFYTDSEAGALGHTSGEWIIDQEPAPGIEGAKHKACTVCGETLETAVMDALPVETEPKTEPATEPEPEIPTEILTEPITEPSLESNITTDEDTNSGTEKVPQKNGCSGSIGSYGSLLLLILAMTPLYIKTKKENE